MFSSVAFECRKVALWKSTLVASIIVTNGIVTCGGPAVANDDSWSTSLNSNTNEHIAINTTTHSISYPVIGPVLPSSATNPGDDFCYNLNPNRDYSNNRCDEPYRGHTGLDLIPPGAAVNEYRVVLSEGGLVLSAGCVAGAGWRVIVRGADGFLYRYFHLAANSINVTQNITYARGRRIGRQGRSDGCSSTGTAAHLHFDRWDGEDQTSPYSNAADPYYSIRASYARPGLKADGTTVDAGVTAAWLRAIANYGGGTTGIRDFGYPFKAVGSTANVQSTTSFWGSGGLRQTIGNGYDTYGTGYRNGVVTRVTSGVVVANQTYGAWVPPEILDVWFDHDEQGGFLGWPEQDPVWYLVPIQQDFEGGCISRGADGIYRAFSYLNSSNPCDEF